MSLFLCNDERDAPDWTGVFWDKSFNVGRVNSFLTR